MADENAIGSIDELRESGAVFLLRRDRRPDWPWWKQVRWWHGSRQGLLGALLQPPSVTGRIPTIRSDPYSVYLTTSRKDGILYAMHHRAPALYEVVVDDAPIRDDVLVDDPSSWRVGSAFVVRQESISRAEQLDAATFIAAHNAFRGTRS